MKINRAIGLLMFVFIAQFLFSGMLASFSQASNAVFGTIETAALLAQSEMVAR